MKKLFFLLSFSILFQNCFSYKSIDYNDIETTKKNKFEIKGVGGTFTEGRLVSKNEKAMVLENKGQTQTISKEKIYEVKVRKFSFLNTVKLIGVSIVITSVSLFLFAVAMM
jgi:hypothetical protein